MAKVIPWADELALLVSLNNSVTYRPDDTGDTLVVSPPENEQGRWGHVLCVDGYIAKLAPSQVNMVIEAPWILATNASKANIDFLKQGLDIQVPQKFRKAYPHAYGAIP